MCLFSSRGIFKRFLLVEREGLDLGCRSSRLRACICVLVLFSSLKIFNRLSSLLEEKVLILKVCLLERESLI